MAPRGCEWIGGRFSPPFFITGEGEPYRVEVVLWMELPDGWIVGQKGVAPGESPGALGRALAEALEQRPRPTSIRVADESLAAEVREVVGDTLPIQVAPTPELDEVVEHLVDSMGGGDEPESYLEDGRIPAPVVQRLFVAAERLYGIAPWRAASDSQVLRLDIPELGVEGAVVSIIGALGVSTGILIFPSLAGHEAFCRLAEEELPPESGRMDFGTEVLAFTFESEADVPAAMRREIETHGWPLAGASAYPRLEHRERDGAPRPLVERDARIAAACASSLATFFVRHRELFESDWFSEPIFESYTDEPGLTVRLTVPSDMYPLEPRRRGPKVGRNDPCPCGSGKKYKKCHLAADQEDERAGSRIDAIHALDARLAAEMSDFAEDTYGEEWSDAGGDFFDPDEAAQLAKPWTLYHFSVEGRPVVDWYLEKHGRRLSDEERAWLGAQRAAWLSVWEVTGVEPGASLNLEDLLSGEVRHVHERLGSRTLVPRDCLLARVVDHAGLALVCGAHPTFLPPMEAAEVVGRARARLRRKRAVPVERLRDEKLGRFLIERWEDAVEERELGLMTPPVLRTTDDEALLFVTDHFDLAAHARGEVEVRLAALDGVVPPEPDEEEPAFVFLRTTGSRLPGGTVLGRVRLSEEALRLETLSKERADALRRRIEEACEGLIHHRTREEADPLEQVARHAPGPESPPPPEAHQLVLEFKEQHYADWPDQPLPALGGRTPREAAETAEGRRAVDVLLRDMENLEQRSSPAPARFDFSRLREALGLDR